MKPKLFDTHCHLNFRAFNNDADEVIKRCLEQKIWLTNIGTDLKTSKKAVEIAEKYTPGVYASVGLHPVHVTTNEVDEAIGHKRHTFMSKGERFDVAAYRPLAQHPKVVAIGEIGLDFYRRKGDLRSAAEWQTVMAAQREDFRQQLDLADELGKATVIHCRQAHDEVLKILEERYALRQAQGNSTHRVRGIAHFFTGTLEQAERYWQLGFYIAFGGAITFVEEYQKLVRAIPLERVVIETDAPYVSAVPHRGERNEPVYVKFAAQKIAELKGVSEQTVAEVTTKNALTVFDINVN